MKDAVSIGQGAGSRGVGLVVLSPYPLPAVSGLWRVPALRLPPEPSWWFLPGPAGSQTLSLGNGGSPATPLAPLHPAGALRYPAPPSAPTLDHVQHPPLAPSQPSPLRPPQDPLPSTLLLQGIQKYPQVCILFGFGWFFSPPAPCVRGVVGSVPAPGGQPGTCPGKALGRVSCL